MNIDKHISDLLYTHDCVIIPGFGGIIGKYAPAYIHPVKHVFYAPYKQLVFNKNLYLNDGVLANYIARVEGITYVAALDSLHRFAGELKSKIEKGQKAEIKLVGTFQLDAEKNIQFTPCKEINYLLSSYGLSSFQSQAILRDKPLKAFKDRPAIAQEKTLSPLRKYWPAIASLPVAFLAVWLPLKTNLLNDSSNQLAAVIPSNSQREVSISKKEEVYTPRTAKWNYTQEEITEEELNLIIKEDNQPVEANNVETSNSLVEEKKKEEKLTKSQPVPVTSQAFESVKTGSYYIIGGCFQEEANAQKYLAKLKEKGYNASILEKKDGLYRVAYGVFNSKEDARTELIAIKSKESSAAWIMAN
jgi:cell division septation protein DedD/nucleoid DNA-binding protein